MQSEFNIAKVELHLHQEEAAPPTPIRQIAHDQKADINGIFDDQGFCFFRDFTHFRKVYEAATRALTEPINFLPLHARSFGPKRSTWSGVYRGLFIP